MSLGQRAFRDHCLHFIRKFQKTDGVCDSSPVPADPFRDLFLCKPVVVDQHLVGHRLFDRVQVLTLYVLYNRDLRSLLRGIIPDYDRDFRETRGLRRTEPSLTGDDPVIVPVLLYEKRLEDTVLADRLREFLKRLFPKVFSGLCFICQDTGDLNEDFSAGFLFIDRLLSGGRGFLFLYRTLFSYCIDGRFLSGFLLCCRPGGLFGRFFDGSFSGFFVA